MNFYILLIIVLILIVLYLVRRLLKVDGTLAIENDTCVLTFSISSEEIESRKFINIKVVNGK